MPWKPIATAPKDGTPVLLWDASLRWPEVCAWAEIRKGERFVPLGGEIFRRETYSEGSWNGYSGAATPTHWAPVPDLPQE